jgi:hypothetical protein
MGERVRTVGDQLPATLSNLALARSLDGRVVIFDTTHNDTGPQFIVAPVTLAAWAGHNVEANVQEGRRTYSVMHAGLGVHARLITTAEVACDFDRKKGVWCVWHQGQASTRFDFERHEADAIVALMGSPEFLEFIAKAPVANRA